MHIHTQSGLEIVRNIKFKWGLATLKNILN